VTVGGASCLSSGLGWSNSFIQCILPSGSGLNQNIIVSVSQQSSNPYLFSYDPPTLLSISPKGGAPGSSVLITGYSFSTSSSSNAAYINGIPCSYFSSNWLQRTITIIVPSNGQGVNVPLWIVVNGLMSANNLTFTYAPVINSVFMVGNQLASTLGGGLLNVTGIGFTQFPAPNGYPAIVTIAGSNCTVVQQYNTWLTW
jgi:hypothetical protein